MITRSKLAHSLKYWGFYGFLICLVIGVLLLKPVFSIIPVLLNQNQAKQDHINSFTASTAQVDTAIITANQTHEIFLPLISFDDPQTEKDNQPQTFKQFSIHDSIDFSPQGATIRIEINPNSEPGENPEQVDVSFLPGEQCILGDGRACVYTFDFYNQSEVVFISVHSGVGAEGEPLRNMIEGTGINKGLYTPDQIITQTQALAGSNVSITQGNITISGLALTTIARIPSAHLETYLSLPVEQTLAYAVALGVLEPIHLKEDMLVIETCGWQLPGEEKHPEYPTSSQSIYIVIVQSGQ